MILNEHLAPAEPITDGLFERKTVAADMRLRSTDLPTSTHSGTTLCCRQKHQGNTTTNTQDTPHIPVTYLIGHRHNSLDVIIESSAIQTKPFMIKFSTLHSFPVILT